MVVCSMKAYERKVTHNSSNGNNNNNTQLYSNNIIIAVASSNFRKDIPFIDRHWSNKNYLPIDSYLICLIDIRSFGQIGMLHYKHTPHKHTYHIRFEISLRDLASAIQNGRYRHGSNAIMAGKTACRILLTSAFPARQQ